MKWIDIVCELNEKDYDFYIDYDEEFFICPECREPIFEYDYPGIRGTVPKCPVCLFEY